MSEIVLIMSYSWVLGAFIGFCVATDIWVFDDWALDKPLYSYLRWLVNATVWPLYLSYLFFRYAIPFLLRDKWEATRWHKLRERAAEKGGTG